MNIKRTTQFSLILIGLSAVLLLAVGSNDPACAADEELEQHLELIQGSGKSSTGDRQIALPEVGKATQHNLVLVTASFTDDALATEAGLDSEALRKTVKSSLSRPDNRFLAARQPVNFFLQHYWVDTRITLGKSKDAQEYFYHVSCSLLKLSPGETTPRRNRYVLLEQKLQKTIAVAAAPALPQAVKAQVAELAKQLTTLAQKTTNNVQTKPAL
jgi:hypothetical protein